MGQRTPTRWSYEPMATCTVTTKCVVTVNGAAAASASSCAGDTDHRYGVMPTTALSSSTAPRGRAGDAPAATAPRFSAAS